MNRDKKLRGRQNILFCVLSVVILAILLFPLYWNPGHLAENRTGDLPYSAHLLAGNPEPGILHRPAGTRRLQHVPFLCQ